MKNQIKKFYEDHKEDIVILGSFTVVNACLWYAIAKTADSGRQVTHLKFDNGDGPPPKEAIIHVVYKNGKHDSFGYKPELV